MDRVKTLNKLSPKDVLLSKYIKVNTARWSQSTQVPALHSLHYIVCRYTCRYTCRYIDMWVMFIMHTPVIDPKIKYY